LKSNPIKKISDKEILQHTINSAEIEGIFLKDKDKEKILSALKEV